MKKNINYKALLSRLLLLSIFSLHFSYCLYKGHVITRFTGSQQEIYFDQSPELFVFLLGIEGIFILFLIYSVSLRIPRHK